MNCSSFHVIASISSVLLNLARKVFASFLKFAPVVVCNDETNMSPFDFVHDSVNYAVVKSSGYNLTFRREHLSAQKIQSLL